MLTIYGKSNRFCDGVSRRDFLKIGGLAMGGLSMAQLLAAEAQAQGSLRKKSIINIYLSGGPSHLDMFDLKPDAPSEIRGEFRPTTTNVPGMDICELFPGLAKNADKFAIIRSVTGVRDEHDPTQSDSGWSENSLKPMGGRPGIGAVMSKLQGSMNGQVPTFVSLNGFGSDGFLGPIHGAYRPDGPGRENLKLNQSVSMNRLNDRRALLSNLDRLRREVDQLGQMKAMDAFSERAMTVITSSQMATALDTSKEDKNIADRYGFGDKSGRRDSNRSFLLARRLVEVGVRCVSFSWGGWDTHDNNFKQLGTQLPALDQGLSALLEDLNERGMLKDTIVMMSGEFGRTPRINGSAGRDHWARAGFFFVAGGGLKTGQVIGSTNRLGEEAKDRPVHIQQIFSTVYRKLEIDPDRVTLMDPNGRPQYLVDVREPIRELL
jgi:hypothetical protein